MTDVSIDADADTAWCVGRGGGVCGCAGLLVDKKLVSPGPKGELPKLLFDFLQPNEEAVQNLK